MNCDDLLAALAEHIAAVALPHPTRLYERAGMHLYEDLDTYECVLRAAPESPEGPL